MKIKKLTFFVGGFALISGGMISCVEDKNSPGLEYMPDMYRSPAIEGYWDYAEVKGRFSEAAHDTVSSKYNFVPPANTIVYQGPNTSGIFMPYKHGAPVNADKTHGLFDVPQEPLGRDIAKNDVNPIPYSPEVEKEGKVLYERFCQHCHGEKGAGDGGVPSSGKYPQPPAYNAGTTKDLTPGEIFYTITYGKNAMGSHASQINKEERWKLVHYIQTLQGKERGKPESAGGNSVTDADGVDGAMMIDGVVTDMDGESGEVTVETTGVEGVEGEGSKDKDGLIKRIVKKVKEKTNK